MANVSTAKRLETRQSKAQTVIQVDTKCLSDCVNKTSMPQPTAQTTGAELLRLVVATNLSQHTPRPVLAASTGRDVCR